jgi:hypothetical protein
MRRVCAWCGKERGSSLCEADSDFVTHGICEECQAFFDANQPKSLRQFLNGFDAPILCMDKSVRVLTANDAACQLLGKEHDVGGRKATAGSPGPVYRATERAGSSPHRQDGPYAAREPTRPEHRVTSPPLIRVFGPRLTEIRGTGVLAGLGHLARLQDMDPASADGSGGRRTQRLGSPVSCYDPAVTFLATTAGKYYPGRFLQKVHPWRCFATLEAL